MIVAPTLLLVAHTCRATRGFFYRHNLFAKADEKSVLGSKRRPVGHGQMLDFSVRRGIEPMIE
jgi:hypothetical protein